MNHSVYFLNVPVDAAYFQANPKQVREEAAQEDQSIFFTGKRSLVRFLTEQRKLTTKALIHNNIKAFLFVVTETILKHF